MKELFREADFSIVGYYRSVLESAGIATFVRNENLGMGLADFPIPEFYPALCVVNDEDFDAAWEIIRERCTVDAAKGEQVVECTHCREENPGNFEICWNCEGGLRQEAGGDPSPG